MKWDIQFNFDIKFTLSEEEKKKLYWGWSKSLLFSYKANFLLNKANNPISLIKRTDFLPNPIAFS